MSAALTDAAVYRPRIIKLEFTKARLKIVVTEDDTQVG